MSVASARISTSAWRCCRLQLPALRDRPDDIPLLAEHLLASSEIGRRQLSPGALAALRAPRWQGNVRELRNVLISPRCARMAAVLPEHITAVIADRESPVRRKITPADALRALEEVGGNVSAAARLADVPRSTMRICFVSRGIRELDPRRPRTGLQR